MRDWGFGLGLALGLAALLAGTAVRAQDLLAFSEDLPPFAYMEDGEHRGFANEVIDRIVRSSGLSIKRLNMPWARSLREAQVEANSLIYVTVRTPEREPQFLWVGPLDNCDIVLMKLRRRSDLKFEPGQAGASLQIGLGRGSPAAALLRDAGVAEGNIYPTPRSEVGVRMLYATHLDMLAGLYLPSLYQVQRNGLDPAELQAFHVLKPGFGCYFAFNTKVNAKSLASFRKGFEDLQNSGELKALREQYLRNPEQGRK